MSPRPGGGDDEPTEDVTGEIDPMDAPLPVLVAGSSSSEGEEDEDQMTAGQDYYQLLPSTDPAENVGESGDEGEGQVHQASQEQLHHHHESQQLDSLSLALQLQMPATGNAETEERKELWSSSRIASTDHVPMDPELADKIRCAMSNFTLPTSCVPGWATVVPENEWKAELISRIHGTRQSTTDDIATNIPAATASHTDTEQTNVECIKLDRAD